VKFYVGLHQPSDARHFQRAFLSVNRMRDRKAPIGAVEWIMDSGAFTEISTWGFYRSSPADYAAEINRWARQSPGLVAAVSQDWMCEPFIIERQTGLEANSPEQLAVEAHVIEKHQRWTIERYQELRPLVERTYLMPVLQGFVANDYLRHLEMYGDLLPEGAYVGVGSVCKRNTNVMSIMRVLDAIKFARPDLRLHGFGLKLTALASPEVCAELESADSMAWSYSARKQGRNGNDWREAKAFEERIAA
jgi:hypothetical protein